MIIDLRILCSPEYKKKVNFEALSRGMSVSRMLLEIIQKEIPEDAPPEPPRTKETIQEEINVISRQLQFEGNTMSGEQRQALRNRRAELQQELKNC